MNPTCVRNTQAVCQTTLHRTFGVSPIASFASGTDTESDASKTTTKPADGKQSGTEETYSFQAETKRLLDIVTNSLYTDKEVFVRELVSNASDALEKCRHAYLVNGGDPGELTVSIETNETDGTFTITDTGLGMTKEELQNNLGVIARSGSKSFVEELNGQDSSSSMGNQSDSSKNIIGKFGVGFYSAFMVSDKVDVFSSTGDGIGYKWSSTGDGSYSMSECEIGDSNDQSPTRGTRIVLHAKDNDKQLAVSEWAIESALKKYSAFVSFPVLLNSKKTNSIDALWTKKESEVSDEDATAFYRFIGSSSVTDTFAFRLHFSADAPLTVRALLFAPNENPERGFGGSQSGNANESGVSLYSRRVLIQQNAKNVLPSFLRFVRGVIDCEDLPLNISRETLQDSALVRKLGEIISKRVIKWLTEKAKKEPENYATWYAKLGVFLKEGICGDESYLYKELLTPLLRFESTRSGDGEKEDGKDNMKDGKKSSPSVTSLDEYIDRMPSCQKEIYYLVATGGRKQAEMSPYLEAMRERGYEVLFLYAHVDEFVMQHVRRHKGKELVSAEAAEFEEDLQKKDNEKEDGNDSSTDSSNALPASTMQNLCDWFATDALTGKVTGVTTSSKLTATPALLTGHEPEAMRRYRAMLTMMADDSTSAKLNELHNAAALELNPKHAIIKGIEVLRNSGDETKKKTAKIIAEQVFDNARVAAGALDDPREMVGRIHEILEIALRSEQAEGGDTGTGKTGK